MLKRTTRIESAKNQNLFPDVEELLAFEKKYGGYVSDVDIEGSRALKKKERPPPPIWDSFFESLVNEKSIPANAEAFMKEAASWYSLTKQETTAKGDAIDQLSIHEQARLEASFEENQRAMIDERVERMPLPPWKKVFYYSSQKLNYVNWYLQYLKEKLAKEDPHAMHMYSKNYLLQSLPDDTDQAEKDKILHQSKFITPNGFSLYRPTPPGEFNKHPKKPSKARIEGNIL